MLRVATVADCHRGLPERVTMDISYISAKLCIPLALLFLFSALMQLCVIPRHDLLHEPLPPLFLIRISRLQLDIIQHIISHKEPDRLRELRESIVDRNAE